MSKEIIDALRGLEQERGISHARLLEGLCDAMLSAYRKTPEAALYARVELDEEEGEFKVYELLIPDAILAEVIIETEEDEEVEAVDGFDPTTGERREQRIPQLDWDRVAEHQADIEERDVTPENFGRIAAMTAKQVIQQRLRQAAHDQVFEEYQGRAGELVVGLVQQSDRRHTLVQLREGVEALLPRSEQVDGERYQHGSRLRTIIKEVSSSERGTSIILSRRAPELVRELFELEVPEAANGLIEIQRVVREPGVRSKIGVISKSPGIDPVGACVGPRGSRVRNIVSELGGEKVDIIPLDVDPARYLAKALSPAQVREVHTNDEQHHATVIVPDDQVALAIGSGGQNVRLTAQLTGWQIDIRSQSQFAEEGTNMEDEESDDVGRCAAVLSSGKRCPNSAEPDSSYCGIPGHQAQAHQAVPVDGATAAATMADAPDPDTSDSDHAATPEAEGDQPEAADIPLEDGDAGAVEAELEDQLAQTAEASEMENPEAVDSPDSDVDEETAAEVPTTENSITDEDTDAPNSETTDESAADIPEPPAKSPGE